MENIILKNNNIYIRIENNGKDFYFKDLTDYHNEESGYTTKKRGVKQFSEMIIKTMTDEQSTIKDNIKFSDIRTLLSNQNIQYRTYCAMD